MTTATATLEALHATDISLLIGSKVHLDKAALLSGEYAADLRELLERRGVIVFPQINFSDEEQIAFTRTMGRFLTEMEGQEVYNITLDKSLNQKSEYLKGSLYWHADGTMNKVPIGVAILTSKVLPTWGGNTEFCNTYAAYDLLPEEEKKQIEGLRATLLQNRPACNWTSVPGTRPAAFAWPPTCINTGLPIWLSATRRPLTSSSSAIAARPSTAVSRLRRRPTSVVASPLN